MGARKEKGHLHQGGHISLETLRTVSATSSPSFGLLGTLRLSLQVAGLAQPITPDASERL